jgi:nitrate reductase gamma subunit
MRDYLLFGVSPYVALLMFVSVCAVRYFVWPVRSTRGTASRRQPPSLLSRIAWRAALAVVVFGHLMAFVFPDYLLGWDRQLGRMIVVEVAGLIAGVLATAGLFFALLRLLRAQRQGGASSPFDVVAGTLGLVATMSGVGTAVFYRWASSWAEVTLVPYVRSLSRLDPSITLVTHLPFLVRLHVVCAFVLLAALPFSDLSRLVLVPVDRLARLAFEPVAGLARAAGPALAARVSSLTHAWSARLLRNGAEEN